MIEYTVQKNDTIAAVKERLNVTWQQIRSQNPHAVGKMRDSGRWFLKEGASLRFENTASETKEATFQDHMERSSLREHKVAPGDSLWSLSRTYSVDVESIAALNNLNNPDLIRVGQTLAIPEGRETDHGNESTTGDVPATEAAEPKRASQPTDPKAAGNGDQALLDALAGDIMPMPLYTGELTIEEPLQKETNLSGKADLEAGSPGAALANGDAVSPGYGDLQRSGVELPDEKTPEATSGRFSITSLRQDDSSRKQVRIQYRPAENTKLFLGVDFERYRKSAYVEKEDDLDLSVLVGISLDF